MARRIRRLLACRLDERGARLGFLAASVVLVGLALVALVGGGEGVQAPPSPQSVPRSRPLPRPQRPMGAAAGQDPQDRHGSGPARRADRELREHAALQHVPGRIGSARITLAGAVHGRAVLKVTAPSAAQARTSWRDFLRRYNDDGRAYVLRIQAKPRTERNRPQLGVAGRASSRQGFAPGVAPGFATGGASVWRRMARIGRHAADFGRLDFADINSSSPQGRSA
jgi:hypothetical protein